MATPASNGGHSLHGAGALFVGGLCALLAGATCGGRDHEDTLERVPPMTAESPDLSPLYPLVDAVAPRWMQLPGVVGVAAGVLDDGRTPCLQVLVTERTRELEERLPRALEGHPVVLQEVGEVRPLRDD